MDTEPRSLGEFVDATLVGPCPCLFGLGGEQVGAARGQGGAVGGQLLVEVFQFEACGVPFGAALGDPLLVLPVIDAYQHLALADLLEVLHPHLGDVAGDLRREHRELAAHIGVLGGDQAAGERPELPGIEDGEHADQGHQRHQDDRAAAWLDRLGRLGWCAAGVRGRRGLGVGCARIAHGAGSLLLSRQAQGVEQ